MAEQARAQVLEVTLHGPEQTGALGAAIASVINSGDVVILIGELGAGKTTLVKGMVAALSNGVIATSPTFALCHLYDTIPVLAHVDCWRLAHESELEDLALSEFLEDGAVAVIEWGELARARFGEDALVVELSADQQGPEQFRHARLSGAGSFRGRLVGLAMSAAKAGLTIQHSEQEVRS